MVKQTRYRSDLTTFIAIAITTAGCALTCVRNLSAEMPDPGAGDPAEKKQTLTTPVDTAQADARPKDITKRLFSGKVLLAQEALKRRGIKVAEEMKSQAVIETDAGRLIAIAADWRGRALYQDKRLRNRKVELVGYQRPGIPYLQVLIIYLIDEKGRRREMDYWCDICAIPMYEIKACECCQGDILLRLRPGKLPSYLTLPESGSEHRKPLQPPRKSGGKPGK